MDSIYSSSVEAGKRNIFIINLEKIVNSLDVDLLELLKGCNIETEN